jgi:hypothetical protein
MNIVQAVQSWGSASIIEDTIATGLGRTTTIGLGISGGIQYFSSSARLVADDTLNPKPDGQFDNTIWTERVGVMTTGIGGAFLAAGAATAVFGGPPGVAVAAVLIPAGLAFTGAGTLMQNWGWVSSTASNISNSAQIWWNGLSSTPTSSTSVQAVPAQTPALQISTPTPQNQSQISTTQPAVSPTQEAPTPAEMPVTTETPAP